MQAQGILSLKLSMRRSRKHEDQFLMLLDLIFAYCASTEAFESLIASEHHLDGGVKFFRPRLLSWSSVRSMGTPMDEYYDLFLGIWMAVSLFFVVQHVGHAFIGYLIRN